MGPKTHERTLNTILVIGISIFVLLIVFRINDPAAIDLVCGTFLAILLAELLLIYVAPVRCTKPGCEGQMQPGWENLAAEDKVLGGWRLFYKCRDCNNVYISNFNLSIGFNGDPYYITTERSERWVWSKLSSETQPDLRQGVQRTCEAAEERKTSCILTMK